MLTMVPHWLTRSCVFILDKLIDPTEALNFQLKVASSYVAEAEARVQKAEVLHRSNVSKWKSNGQSAMIEYNNFQSIYQLAISTIENAEMCESNLNSAAGFAHTAKDKLSSALASGAMTIEIASTVEREARQALVHLEEAEKIARTGAYNSLYLAFERISARLGKLQPDDEEDGEARVERLQQEEYDKDEEDGVACSICLNNFGGGDAITRMPCSHLFHDGCLREWLVKRKNCPICRTKL